MTSFDVGYLDKFEIRTYYNILPEEERLVLRHKGGLNLKKISGAPGLQTYSNLHLLSEESDYLINKIREKVGIENEVLRSWINYTDHRFSYEFWHNHNQPDYHEFTCVYMIENPENVGTWFKYNDKIYKSRCPTNSAITFSKRLDHTVPPIVTKPRYSLAIDFHR